MTDAIPATEPMEAPFRPKLWDQAEERGTVGTMWIFLGATALLHRSAPELGANSLFPILAGMATGGALWTGIVRSIRERSSRPMAIAIPVALVSALLTEWLVTPIRTPVFGLAGAIIFGLNLLHIPLRRAARRIWPAKWRGAG